MPYARKKGIGVAVEQKQTQRRKVLRMIQLRYRKPFFSGKDCAPEEKNSDESALRLGQ